MDNENPLVFEAEDMMSDCELQARKQQESDCQFEDPIDKYEVFEIVRHILDPEHPLTLEQLRVLSLEQVYVEVPKRTVEVHFTPTIPHCSSASIIGLMIHVKLIRS